MNKNSSQATQGRFCTPWGNGKSKKQAETDPKCGKPFKGVGILLLLCFKRIHLGSTVELESHSLSSDSNPKDDHYSLVCSDSNGNRREAHSRMDRNLDLTRW